MTFGLGKFWTRWQPTELVGCDLDPDRSPIGYPVDCRKLPFDNGSFDSVVFDPPYIPAGGGSWRTDSHTNHTRYARSLRKSEIRELYWDGMAEGARVARSYLLVKVMDQVGDWQTFTCTTRAVALGLRKVDRFDLIRTPGYDPHQVRRHASHNYSTLLVFGVSHVPGAPTHEGVLASVGANESWR
jgi:hypothetical protein